MPLGEEFERSGAWLFQRRSYVPPLLLIGVAVAASERPGRDGIPGLEAPAALAGLAVALVGLVIRAVVVGSAPGAPPGKTAAPRSRPR